MKNLELVIFVFSFSTLTQGQGLKPGDKVWEFQTGGRVSSSPAIGADGTVYVGSDDKKVYALDGKTGAKQWEFETGGMVFSSPAIGADGTVYVGSEDKKVYALNSSGIKKWEFVVGGFASPSIGSDGTIYVGSWRREVYALNPDGTKKWQFERKNSRWPSEYSSPSIGSDGTVYVGSADKKVYALDGKTGAKQWEFETGDAVFSSPAIGSNGTVYVGSYDKKVYALDGKTGAKQWEFETGGMVFSSPAIGADGTVYVGSDDKKVYALKSSSSGPADSPWPMFGQNAQRTGKANLKTTPVITWNNPQSITYGVRISGKQLNARADIRGGKFIYDSPKGTLLEAGTHTLKVTYTPSDQKTYRTVDAQVTLVVKKLPLTIFAEDKKRNHGEPNPPLTIGYEGFVSGEDESVLLSKPTLSTTAETLSKPGVYPITIVSGTAKNYEITLKHGKMEVYEAEIKEPELTDFKVVQVGEKVSFKFNFDRQPLRQYSIQRSSNLKEWTSDGPPIQALPTASIYRFSRTIDTEANQGLFYRVLVVE